MLLFLEAATKRIEPDVARQYYPYDHFFIDAVKVLVDKEHLVEFSLSQVILHHFFIHGLVVIIVLGTHLHACGSGGAFPVRTIADRLGASVNARVMSLATGNKLSIFNVLF